MATEKDDEDIEALIFDRVQTVVQAMLDLKPESRLRIYRTAGAFFGFEPKDPEPPDSARDARDPYFPPREGPGAKEFLLQKQPTTVIERVACLAYYLKEYRESPHFKTIDINKLNTEAAQPKLANASAAINNALTAGLVIQVGGGMRQISAHGEIYVETLPDRVAAKAATASQRVRKQRKTQGRKESTVSDGNAS